MQMVLRWDHYVSSTASRGVSTLINCIPCNCWRNLRPAKFRCDLQMVSYPKIEVVSAMASVTSRTPLARICGLGRSDLQEPLRIKDGFAIPSAGQRACLERGYRCGVPANLTDGNAAHEEPCIFEGVGRSANGANACGARPEPRSPIRKYPWQSMRIYAPSNDLQKEETPRTMSVTCLIIDHSFSETMHRRQETPSCAASRAGVRRRLGY